VADFDFAVCLAGSFFALLTAVAFPLILAALGFRAGERDATAFDVAPFAPVRLAPEPADRAGFGLVSLAVFGRETFTRPRMARPDRAFAAAFAVARRVGLLCKVEAMGTALVTVVTRVIRPVAVYTKPGAGATATCGYRRVAPPSSADRLKPVHGGGLPQVR
jgi:hypothetical protein